MYNRPELWKAMHDQKAVAIKEFQDKKFGMFIHFGLYSTLAGEYKGTRIEEGVRPYIAEWIMHALCIGREEYGEIMKDFDPVDFSGEAFALLAKKAGMKYIVLTTKHHEGFSLFHSDYSDYTMENTKSKRDLVDELYQACKKHGVDFGVYYSHSIDWYDGGDGGVWDYRNDNNIGFDRHPHNEWDPSPCDFDKYMKEKAIPQVKELVERYPNMKYIWFDVATLIPEKYSFELYKMIFDVSPDILVSHRIGNGFGDVFCPGDNRIIKEYDESIGAWETVGTMNNSWGFKYYDHDWKYPKEVLFWLVEIISKGGSYMLNIGPDQTGKIPNKNVEILSDIGKWIDVYGESFYGTTAWTTTFEGVQKENMDGTVWREENGFNSDFGLDQLWFTQKDNKIYAISLYSGEVSSLKIKSIKDLDIDTIKLLGSKNTKWTKNEEEVEITFETPFVSEVGFAVEITVK